MNLDARRKTSLSTYWWAPCQAICCCQVQRPSLLVKFWWLQLLLSLVSSLPPRHFQIRSICVLARFPPPCWLWRSLRWNSGETRTQRIKSGSWRKGCRSEPWRKVQLQKQVMGITRWTNVDGVKQVGKFAKNLSWHRAPCAAPWWYGPSRDPPWLSPPVLSSGPPSFDATLWLASEIAAHSENNRWKQNFRLNW